MRIAKQRRVEIFLIFTSIASTMLVMQRLWNQTNNCDPLCKVAKEVTYPPTTADRISDARLCSTGRSNLSETTTTTAALNHRRSPVTQSIASAAAAPAPAPAASSSSTTAPLSASVPFSRFEKRQPKLLAILTYQRCGSTFFGGLFNHNPNAFYMFEPLDSLYSSLYGTKMGWNVPSDIANHSNGTHRVLPDIELEKVFEFLRSLFSCEVGSLPTETLVHPYIHDIFSREFSVNRNYVLCVRKHRRKIDKCMQSLPWSYCGGRFGEMSPRRLDDCRRLLNDDEFRRQNRHPKQIDDYLDCRRQLRLAVDQKCSPMLASTCQNRQLRVIKLVRASMESMRPLLEAFPNFRIIHLVRDPRAVTLSRKNFDSSARGLYTESDGDNQLTREAVLYCRTVVRDVEARKRLEKLHPGKIYSIIYDDMVRNLRLYSQNVYRFLDANSSMPLAWIKQISASANVRRALDKATRWQKVLTAKTNREIVAACHEFFQTVAYDWPKMT